MTDTVLCINAGSSSLKFKLFEALADGGLSVSIEGQLDGIGVKPHLKAADGAARPLADRQLSPAQAPDTGAAVPMLLQWLRDQLNGVVPVVIGHRVVFGGTRYAVTNAICFSSLWPNDTKRQAL
jgi:acetate kinase